MKKCSKCGNEVNDDLNICNECGYDLSQNDNSQKKTDDKNIEFENEKEQEINNESECETKNNKRDNINKIMFKNPVLSKIIIVSVILVLAIVIYTAFVMCHHKWDKATCTEPKTCVKCGKTEGKSLGHKYKKATCKEPQICERCSETKGEALGHTDGEWEIEDYGTINRNGLKVKKCTVCDEIIDEESIQVYPRGNGNEFNFTESEFIQYIKRKINSLYKIQSTGEEVEGMPLYFMQVDSELVMFAFKSNSYNKVTNILLLADDKTTTLAVAGLFAKELTDSFFDSEAFFKDLLISKEFKLSDLYCCVDNYKGKVMLSIRPKK